VQKARLDPVDALDVRRIKGARLIGSYIYGVRHDIRACTVLHQKITRIAQVYKGNMRGRLRVRLA
jgi:hypothetical protein